MYYLLFIVRPTNRNTVSASNVSKLVSEQLNTFTNAGPVRSSRAAISGHGPEGPGGAVESEAGRLVPGGSVAQERRSRRLVVAPFYH